MYHTVSYLPSLDDFRVSRMEVNDDLSQREPPAVATANVTQCHAGRPYRANRLRRADLSRAIMAIDGGPFDMSSVVAILTA
jgi:hypothetical protein